VRLALLSADGLGRTFLQAGPASPAFLNEHLIGEEALALMGRAILLANVLIVLVSEVPDGAADGVGRARAESAECAIL